MSRMGAVVLDIEERIVSGESLESIQKDYGMLGVKAAERFLEELDNPTEIYYNEYCNDVSS